jgi:hypothetical protein
MEVHLVPSGRPTESVVIDRRGGVERFVPVPIHATASTDDYEIDYVVDAGPLGGNATFECRALTVRARDGGPAVSSAGVRISVSKLVRAAVELAAVRSPNDIALPLSALVMAGRDRHLIDDESLRDVAALVRDHGRYATAIICATYKVRKRTAYRAIQRARDAGYITDEEEKDKS